MKNQEQVAAGLYEHVKESALRILMSGDEVLPMAFVPSGRDKNGVPEVCVMPIPMNGKTAKEARGKGRFFIQGISAVAPLVILVQECWWIKRDKDDGEFEKHLHGDAPPPSECPDKREGLMVTLISEGKVKCVASRAFTRIDGKVTLDDPDKWQETGPEMDIQIPEGSVMPHSE